MTKSNDKDSSSLLHTLISMVFAVVVAGVLENTSQVIIKNRDNSLILASSIAQVLLTVVIVLLSWFSWSQSIADNNKNNNNNNNKVKTSDSKQIGIAFVDLIIVSFYFALIKTTDNLTNTASARPETIIAIAIFFFYVIWDFLNQQVNYLISMVPFLMVLIIYLIFNDSPESFQSIIITDLYLVVTAIFFRTLKFDLKDTTGKWALSKISSSLGIIALILIVIIGNL